ncbi:MAG TPA: 3'(2'),5'-bisphosphate nucleotidase [Candidatus Hydrogenedentes bacterium]|nr:3'(2'),5'-bisphosphate nucleotidase [Candidatus Hydrogenedentota bacterium]
MLDYDHPDVRFAVDVVQQAARLCRRIQTGMAMLGLTKSDFSPVTVADYAVQAFVGHALAGHDPEAVLVGEEKADALREDTGQKVLDVVTQFVGKMIEDASSDNVLTWIDRGGAEPTNRYWTLDPVDGTKGYLRGGQYAVALALLEHGEVKLGVLGCPNLGEHCAPVSCGAGAILVGQRGEGSAYAMMDMDPLEFMPLHVSDCRDASQARVLRSFESSHTNADDTNAIAQRLGISAEPVLMDSLAKFAVLAAGGGEMMFRFPPQDRPGYQEKIWDNAAGAVILEEAGGRVTDIWGKPLDFTTGRRLTNNSGIFASNGWLHEAGVNAIKEVCG